MCNCNSLTDAESKVSVKVDVTRIVKYVCVAGVLIVAVIFITRCINNMVNIKHSAKS